MANTLTGLTPTLYESLDTVARELVGFIPAVSRDHNAERAALNQTIDVPITQAQAAQTVTPGVTAPSTGSQTVLTTPIQITQSQFVPIQWQGEEQRGLLNAGTYHGILKNQFTQAFRTLTNAIELLLWQTAYAGASRATGTAGTTPFATATDLSPLANLRQILDNNGAPGSDLQFVMGNSAAAKLRGFQTILLQKYSSGGTELLRNGSVSEFPVMGFDMHISGQIAALVAGTGTSYVTSGDSPAGTTSIALVTGSGTVKAGDVVTFGADTGDKFVVNTGVSAPGTIVIGAPGTIIDVPTANAMTIGAAYTPNMGFHRSSIQLVTRIPAAPVGPDGKAQDMADDSIIVTDPVSGLAFEIALYRQYMQMQFQVRVAFGAAAIKPNFIATLMG